LINKEKETEWKGLMWEEGKEKATSGVGGAAVGAVLIRQNNGPPASLVDRQRLLVRPVGVAPVNATPVISIGKWQDPRRAKDMF
jgi:hypothetical protein